MDGFIRGSLALALSGVAALAAACGSSGPPRIEYEEGREAATADGLHRVQSRRVGAAFGSVGGVVAADANNLAWVRQHRPVVDIGDRDSSLVVTVQLGGNRVEQVPGKQFAQAAWQFRIDCGDRDHAVADTNANVIAPVQTAGQ